MPGPAIEIFVNDSALADVRKQLSEARKEYREVKREAASIRKKGGTVPQELIDRGSAAQDRIGQLLQKRTQIQQGQWVSKFIKNPGNAMNVPSTGMVGNMLRDSIGQTLGSMPLPGGATAAGIAGRAGIAGLAVAGFAAGFYGAALIDSPYSEAARTREASSRILDTENMDPTQKALKRLEIEQSRSEDKYAILDTFSGIPALGKAFSAISDIGKFIEQRAKGLDVASRADTILKETLRTSGVGIDAGDTENQRRTYAKRMFSNMVRNQMIGETIEGLYEMLPQWARLNSIEQKTLDAAKGSLTLAKQMESEGFRQMAEHNYTAAETNFAEAARETNRMMWKTPQDLWFALDAGRKATVNYALNQNPTPPLRIGM